MTETRKEVNFITPIVWKIERTKEGPWIAYCDQLGMVDEADTIEELLKNIPSIISGLVIDTLEGNDFNYFFTKMHGIEYTGNPYGDEVDFYVNDLRVEFVETMKSVKLDWSEWIDVSIDEL